MTEIDFGAWVRAAANPGESKFRKAVHTVAVAVASSRPLSDFTFLKGGILLALRYRSPRHTTDIDFSTPRVFSEVLANEVCNQLEEGLAIAADQLNYDLECRLQSKSVRPRDPPEDSAWVTLTMRVAYADRGTAGHTRLSRGQGSDVLDVEYSFLERVPSSDSFDIDAKCRLQVYGLSTVIAEKLRALLQQPSRDRYRRQDIYDLNRLLGNDRWPDVFHAEVLKVLLEKAEDRDITPTSTSFGDSEIYRRAKRDYPSLAHELDNEENLPDFDESFSKVRAFYQALPW